MPPIQTGSLGEVARLFFKLGLIAFGGPAAHTAMMREEVVRRRKWTTDDEVDLVARSGGIVAPALFVRARRRRRGEASEGVIRRSLSGRFSAGNLQIVRFHKRKVKSILNPELSA